MTNSNEIALKPGVRFAIRNQAYEICFCSNTNIRYSACSGGRSTSIPTETFWELVDAEVIGFLRDASSQSGEDGVQLWQLNEQERSEMTRRYAYVAFALQSKFKPMSLKTFALAVQHIPGAINDSRPPSHATLSRWIKRFRESGGNIKSLSPNHRNKGQRQNRFAYEIEAEITEAIKTEFFGQRMTVEQFRCNVVGRAQSKPWLKTLRLPAKRSFYRRIANLDPYLVAVARHGRKYADGRFRAAGESFDADRPMQNVMIDGHRMDVLVIDKETGEILGRPYLVALFDVATRTVVGSHISLMPFCATTALAAIKVMCSTDPGEAPGGVPERIVPDNGPDLASAALRNLCNWLGCHIDSAKKFSPNDKAHIERFFRTLNEMLVHLLAGTTFSSPIDRGEYASEKLACYTLDEIRNVFEKWLRTVYHVHIHSQTQRAPLLHWKELQRTYPIVSHSSAEIDVIARIPYERTINQGRVLVDHLHYKSDALTMLAARGKTDVIVLVDEMDLGFVYVQHRSEPTILYRADATRSQYAGGLTKYEHDEVKKRLLAQAKQDKRTLGEYSYEIARWELWQDLHSIRNSRSSRRLAHLRNESAKKRKINVKTESSVLVTEANSGSQDEMDVIQQVDDEVTQIVEFTHKTFSL